MPKAVDIAGVTFGRLTAVRYSGMRNRHCFRLWLCRCECGKEALVPVASLTRGHTKSCGCLQADSRRESRKRTQFFNERFFETIETEEQAYWLGFCTADLSLFAKGYCFSLGLSGKDKGHVEKFRAALGSDKKITHVSHGGFPSVHGADVLALYSKPLVCDLARHGVVTGSLRRTPPPVLPDSLWRHYWRGLIDGDGGFARTRKKGRHLPEWSMHLVGSEECVKRFQQVSAEATGATGYINSKATTKPGQKLWRWGLAGSQQVLFLARHLYDGATVYLDRKKATYEELLRHPFKQQRDLEPIWTHDGKRLRISEWSALTGHSVQLLRRRVYALGWPVGEALTLACRCRSSTGLSAKAASNRALLSPMLTHNGVTKSRADWAREANIPPDTFRHRIENLKWPIDRALTTPVKTTNRRRPA